MGWDGSGNVNRTNGTNSGTTVWQDDRDDGVNIRADRHDTHDEDLAGALENTVALDGQTTTTTDNSLLWYHGTNNAFEGFEVVASRIVGRKSTGDVGAVTAEEAQRVLGDDEHATDSGTDAYVSATTTTAPAAGVRIYRDFQSANTTTTPTLDSLTITTRDGSALWANALSGVHELQLNAGGTAWLVLDPNKADNRDALAAPGTSTDPALAFNTWRTPNANRPVRVEANIRVDTDGSSGGTVRIDVDEGGGTTADYNHRIFASPIGGANFQVTEIVSLTIPAGGSYQIRNDTDPTGNNSIETHREFTL